MWRVGEGACGFLGLTSFIAQDLVEMYSRPSFPPPSDSVLSSLFCVTVLDPLV